MSTRYITIDRDATITSTHHDDAQARQDGTHMKLKTYTAETMAQALAEVRKDLGANAMILHTRSFRSGSWLGLGGKEMVEITASSPQPTTNKPRKTRKAQRSVAAPVIQETQTSLTPNLNKNHISELPDILIHQSPASNESASASDTQRASNPKPTPQRNQEPHTPTKQSPIDDRSALLEGLMGQRRVTRPDAHQPKPAMRESANGSKPVTPNPKQSIPAPPPPNTSRLPNPTSSGEFVPTTFKEYKSATPAPTPPSPPTPAPIPTTTQALKRDPAPAPRDNAVSMSIFPSVTAETVEAKPVQPKPVQPQASTTPKAEETFERPFAIETPPTSIRTEQPSSAALTPFETSPAHPVFVESKPETLSAAEPETPEMTPAQSAADLNQPAQAVEPEGAPVDAPQLPAAQVENQKSDSEKEALSVEIESLKAMMGQVLDSTRRTAVAVNKSNPNPMLPGSSMPAPLQALYTEMIDNDVSVELADRCAGVVRNRLDADELEDPSVVRLAMLREIESTIETVSDSLLTQDPKTNDPNQRPQVLALIGPTGVGKTTTVAKLAATAKLRHGKKVALITSDTYRIAAVEQLRTYASIIGLELKIANTPDEISSVIESLKGVDLIVIDTAGRSQNNHARLDDLGSLIEAAQPDETHLVLSSTVSENVLRKTAERFRDLGPDRCILTKLDEAVTTGMIAGISDRIGLPLSYVTIGQEVPDDILPARADRLARAVLDGPEAVVPMTEQTTIHHA